MAATKEENYGVVWGEGRADWTFLDIPEGVTSETTIAASSETSSNKESPSLKDAKKLGDLVHGTTEGSVYGVIGLGGRLHVAAKIHSSSHTVSIRLEGPAFEADSAKLDNETSFTVNDTYASLHVDCHNNVMCYKVLGSALGEIHALFGLESVSLRGAVWEQGDE